jgi:hypothetical protein
VVEQRTKPIETAYRFSDHARCFERQWPGGQTRSGGITATIAFCVDGWCFPENEWRDFLVILGDWWTNALHELNERGQAVMAFMDGPFEVQLRATDQGDVVVEFMTRRSTKLTTEKTITLRHQDLVSMLAHGFLKAADVLEEAACPTEGTEMRRIAARIAR